MHLVDFALDDGTYDAFVVWAEQRDDGTIALDLTLTTGPRKGEVLSIRARGLRRDPFDVTGIACTLIVEGGEPRVDM
jgi:hypothetical protein